MVSSTAHRRAPPNGIEFDNLDGRRGYRPYRAYGQSKLANLLFAKALSRRLPRSGQTSSAVHPGVIRTRLQRHMNPVARGALALIDAVLLKSIAEGAATQCYAAVHPAMAGVTGRYLADCNGARPSRLARDESLQERLWDETERIAEALAASGS